MFRFTNLAFAAIPIAVLSLLEMGGCIATSFSLGYVTGAVAGPAQPQTTCFLNGEPVDCNNVPEATK